MQKENITHKAAQMPHRSRTKPHKAAAFVLPTHPISTEIALLLPVMDAVSAGFPSPAADFLDTSIDLN